MALGLWPELEGDVLSWDARRRWLATTAVATALATHTHARTHTRTHAHTHTHTTNTPTHARICCCQHRWCGSQRSSSTHPLLNGDDKLEEMKRNFVRRRVGLISRQGQ